MENVRFYGLPPFRIVVVHGGPGACGEMAPVAKKLSSNFGIIEPLLRSKSLNENIKEVHRLIQKNGVFPVTLIGYSWGALFCNIFSSRYPILVQKIILISSGCFDEKNAKNIMKTRLNRLNEIEKLNINIIMKKLDDQTFKDKNGLFEEFGKLIQKADTYDSISRINSKVEYNYKIFQKIWKDTENMRHNGLFIEFGKKIKCPVVAIHGDYDPHPWEDIKNYLTNLIKDFRFILLKDCGHCPWIEKKLRILFTNT